MKIHVLLKKEELDAQRLPGKTVVVLDILFATSSIVAAMAHGATEVIPTLDGTAAQAEAARHPAGTCVLSGEFNAETLPGFVHPTPLALLAENLEGKTLVYSTTNGTVAVNKAREADHVYAAALLNGEAVVKGRSLFRDRIGETVAAPFVTLVDDPTNPKAYTATDVDGEGLAARRNVLIDDGVLRQFVHNSYSARRAGTVSTGNATRGGFAGTPGVGCLALSLAPGSRTQQELIADVDDGLLVQQMQGLHSGVNPISGDFSTGAAGLLITNGTVGAPVREITIASTLQRMLLDIVEVGGDLEWLPMRSAGMSLVIRDVTMSGT